MSYNLKVLAAIASLALAGCAGQTPDTKSSMVERQCFSASSVRGFNPIDDTTVQLEVARGDIYELKLMSFCPDIDWSHTIGVRNRSGSSLICTQDALAVEIVMLDRGRTIGPETCRVRSIRKLDPEEVKAQRAAILERRLERRETRSKSDSP